VLSAEGPEGLNLIAPVADVTPGSKVK